MPPAPSSLLEELKLRLQLKDHLFQEVLADRTQQAQEHQEQVQDLLRSINARDQYIQVGTSELSVAEEQEVMLLLLQDSASQLGEVMLEQTRRLQELRLQLCCSRDERSESEELQALKEELHVALRRGQEEQELSRSQAAMLESLSRRLQLKEGLMRVRRKLLTACSLCSSLSPTGKPLCLQELQEKMVEPPHLPLVEQLTQEVQELRESLVQQCGPTARGPILARGQHGCGGGHQRSMGQEA